MGAIWKIGCALNESCTTAADRNSHPADISL
jgi:hypothetical protein